MKTGMVTIAPPQASEYAPYYSRYISLVKGDDILTALEHQLPVTKALFSSLTSQQGDFRYAPDKWSVKQVLGHVVDTERIFSYRALRIARGDQTPIEGFEQDDYARDGFFENRTLSNLLDEYETVRKATLSLFQNLDPAAWGRSGTANNNKITVRAAAYIIAGHELHHMQVLKEKYFPVLERN
jgi:hypothetical protein